MTVRQETESRSDSYQYLGEKGTEGSDTFSGVQENAKMVASYDTVLTHSLNVFKYSFCGEYR